jgi:hypothetical protein
MRLAGWMLLALLAALAWAAQGKWEGRRHCGRVTAAAAATASCARTGASLTRALAETALTLTPMQEPKCAAGR